MSDLEPPEEVLPPAFVKRSREPFRIDVTNIQNEFGICGWILTILSYLVIFFTLPISACMCIKVVQEYERAVIFRLGRLMPGGAKGPGIFFIVPCIDTYRKVDLRVLSFEVPPQEILSKDSVTVAVDAVVYFRISNATISVTNVEDAARSTKLLAQTTLRNILGTKTLAEMLSDREAISHQMQNTLDEATEPWGVKVERVEVKDVRLPVQLQRAMAAEAEAAREARAKVIVAEGEQKASRALKEAAEVIAESPSALQLRYLQTLNSISAEKNSTIIFPFPIDLLSAFLQRSAPKIEETPVMTKKIRNCCLHKYPDWVQGLSKPGHQHAQQHARPMATAQSMRDVDIHSNQPMPGPSGSGGQPVLYAQPANSVTQLESGQGMDPRRPTALGQKGRQGSAGQHSLLKQAIANRIGREEPDTKSGPEKTALLHPGWRNGDGHLKEEQKRADKPGPSNFPVAALEKMKIRSNSKDKLLKDDEQGTGTHRLPAAENGIRRGKMLTRENSDPSLTISSKTDTTVRMVPITKQPKADLSPKKERKKSSKQHLGERRESSVSDSSRVSIQSGKSVKFSDQILITEIERRQKDSSSDEDVALMSDDESRRGLREDDDDDFEELEKKILEEQKELESRQKPTPLPLYRITKNAREGGGGVETGSVASFYPEDSQPDRFLIGEEEYEYVSLDQLPDSVRQAVLRDIHEQNIYEEMGDYRQQQADREGSGVHMGSMSRLHDLPQSPNGSNIVVAPPLPRSASGYLDDDTGLHDSYQQAVQSSGFGVPLQGPRTLDRPNMLLSYYDNVQGGYVGTSQTTKSPTSPSQDNRYPAPGIYNAQMALAEMRGDPAYPTSPKRELNVQEQRQAFFRSMLPGEEVQSTPTSPTSPEETAMRRQFVQRYGRRKAPIAEVDPADPRPSLGSQDSVASTESHESVVSATSMRAERAVRRDFNY
ncbi:unnamed protein product, partial [Mesorhabditis spiculigera]